MFNRRQFLQLTGLSGTGLFLAKRAFGYPFPYSPHLAKFIQNLPGLGPSGIPVATPIKVGSVDTYRITMREFHQHVHPNLPATKLWGYADATHNSSPAPRYLGPAIVAQRGTPVHIAYTNELPNSQSLPVDTTLPGDEPGQPVNRAVPHLHGGVVPWTSDGGPLSWFTPGNAKVGVDFVSSNYVYPNDQSARLMWYHDHAIGNTRLNVYAGLAAPYILRDSFENWLIQLGVLPSGPYEVPLVIQDKIFNSDGSLGYPDEYDKTRWTYGPDDNPPAKVKYPNLPVPSCVPEFFGDTILVNGAVYPVLNVERRAYRFRILNASQARFYNLQLFYAKAGQPTEANTSAPGPSFIQIGTEGGFLPVPVVIRSGTPFGSKPIPYNLLLAPAERADVIIDFSSVPAGSKLILYNNAPAPFPGGDNRNDYQTVGTGPDSHTLMQIVVGSGTLSPDFFSDSALASYLSSNPAPQLLGGATMDKTLNEDYDDYGRLLQRVGTTTSLSLNNQGLATYGLNFNSPATEVVKPGEIQIWRVFNRTADTHPMHFHLVNVLVLSRARFDPTTFQIVPNTTRFPDKNEQGYKETVRMNPGEVTEVVMKFDLPSDPGPISKRTGGYNYVWHCHILEHEEHDMMRPLIVKP
ncbi:MAG: multicopper oxidase family protein [Bryobacteraceae bacterium]